MPIDIEELLKSVDGAVGLLEVFENIQLRRSHGEIGLVGQLCVASREHGDACANLDVRAIASALSEIAALRREVANLSAELDNERKAVASMGAEVGAHKQRYSELKATHETLAQTKIDVDAGNLRAVIDQQTHAKDLAYQRRDEAESLVAELRAERDRLAAVVDNFIALPVYGNVSLPKGYMKVLTAAEAARKATQ